MSAARAKNYASIRTENPGAQWDNELARRFGMVGREILKDGNHIAIFPNHIQGAAANMALFDRNYTGMTISAGQKKWSGGHRATLPGWNGGTIVTKAMTANPDFMIKLMKSIAEFEAPGGAAHVKDHEWLDAFWLYRKTMYGEERPREKPKPIAPPKPEPNEPAKSRTIIGGIIGWLVGATGWISALSAINNVYALAAFLFFAVLGTLALWMIVSGRIRIGNVAAELQSQVVQLEAEKRNA